MAVTSEIPRPLDSGGHIRSFHPLFAMARRFRLRLVVPVAPGQEPIVDALAARGIAVRGVAVEARARWRGSFGARGGAPGELESPHGLEVGPDGLI